MESLPDLELVRQRLGAGQREFLEEVLPASPVWAVGPGDLLATAVWQTGVNGSTVRGEEIPPPRHLPDDLGRQALEAGPGVDVSGDCIEYTASRWGYASRTRGQLSVLRPLWIRADGAEAYVVLLPWTAGSRAPAVEDLRALLDSAGVRQGIDEGALAALCQRLSQGPHERTLVPVARGRPPAYPKDAQVSFHFRYESGAGIIRADGSIDFRERNAFPRVDSGDLLVECRLAVPGQEV